MSTRFLRRHLTALILIISSIGPIKAAGQPDNDSIRVSLLTCGAGDQIYSMFGHTAIRIEIPDRGIDRIYNYGIFDFNTPNFIVRFSLGETDYQLGVSEYERFVMVYQYHNRGVWQQTLNLHQAEKERLLRLLEENYLPENRTYRYNFFYDNCATRPRDMIERSIAGEVIYPQHSAAPTFRSIIHQHSHLYPWYRFGMDLCLGSKADRPITERESMYAPFYLMHYYSSATIGGQRMLVGEARVLVQESDEAREATPFTPLRCALLLFILITASTLYGLKKRRSLWGIDLVLFLFAGIVGAILAFLALFSTHPAVSPNYLLFVFHPLHLLALPFFIIRTRRGKISRYHLANAIVLTLFMLLWWLIPQEIDFAVLPLALALLVRSVGQLILYSKRKG